MSNNFEWTEFNSGAGSRSADQYFEMSHNPSLGYTHIQKSASTLQSGLEKFDDEEQRMNAEIYANIGLFRETMQYIEEFGLYFRSRLDENVNFIEGLTQTNASEVKNLFENIRDHGLDSAITDFIEEEPPEEWLKELFGYKHIEQNDVSASDLNEGQIDIDVDNLSTAIEQSLCRIYTLMEELSEFFLKMDEPYNAVKHGNRVFPMQEFYSQIEIGDELYTINVNEPFVEFLCKTSGDRRGGETYTFIAPVRMIREQAIAIANSTHGIYQGMYDLKQSITEAQESNGDELVTFPLKMWGVDSEADSGVSHDFTSFDSPDGVIWIPQDAIPEEFEEYSGPTEFQTATAFYLEGDDLVIETDPGSRPSYEYPFAVEGTFSSDPRELLGSTINQNFEAQSWQIPIWQYLEMVDITSAKPFDTVRVRVQREEETNEEIFEADMDFPKIPVPDDLEAMRFLKRVGLAADAEIYCPLFPPKEATDIVNEYKDKELTKEVAEDCLSDIRTETSNYVVTVSRAFVLDASSQSDEGYQVIRSEIIDEIPYAIVGDHNKNAEGMDLSKVNGGNSKYKGQSERDSVLFGACYVSKSPSEILELFEQEGLEAITQLPIVDSSESSEALVEIAREQGSRYIWNQMDFLEIRIYEEMPDHIENLSS